MTQYKSKLIIIRGNSASGKSTVAKRIRELSDRKIAYVEQDNIRRTILKEKETNGGVNIDLIKQVTTFALAHEYDVILEGMFIWHRYGEMLKELVDECADVHVFYFDVSFKETLNRHKTKPIANKVDPDDFKQWYKHMDVSGLPGELIIPEEYSIEQSAEFIIGSAGL